MENLKKRITMSGITRKELAKQIGVKYSLLNQYLNEFLEMPEQVKKNIDKILKETKNEM